MSQVTNFFNRLTGFIEVYSSDTKFESDVPHRPLQVNLTAINGSAEGGGAETVEAPPNTNGATNEPLAKIDFLSSVNISSSFKALTDNCEITIPRIDKWLKKDYQLINNFSLYDPQAFDNDKIFAEGNIVRVFLGYDFQDKLMFHGYVSEVSNTSPVKVKLEDGMYLLKQKYVNGVYKNKDDETKDVRLSDFIDDILEGTGVELHPSVAETADQITFGKYFQAKQSTTARVLKDIQDRGLSVFFELGKLIIGRTYFDSSLTPHISTISNPNYEPPLVHNEFNVPEGGNKLETTTMNKKRNMVTVQKYVNSNRVIQLNVALDPREKEDIFIPVAIHDSSNKKDATKIANLTDWLVKNYNASIDTDGYSQITATMDAVGGNVPKSTDLDSYKSIVDEMFDYGKDMFWKYFDNGLGGTIDIFGDYGIQTAQSVDIFDPRNPEVNAEYLVTEVKTKWGFGGYRQTLKIGIKIKDNNVPTPLPSRINVDPIPASTPIPNNLA